MAPCQCRGVQRMCCEYGSRKRVSVSALHARLKQRRLVHEAPEAASTLCEADCCDTAVRVTQVFAVDVGRARGMMLHATVASGTIAPCCSSDTSGPAA